VSANKLQRLHRKKYKDTQEKIHQAWGKYEDEITTNQLRKPYEQQGAPTASNIDGLGPSERGGDDFCEDE